MRRAVVDETSGPFSPASRVTNQIPWKVNAEGKVFFSFKYISKGKKEQNNLELFLHYFFERGIFDP